MTGQWSLDPVVIRCVVAEALQMKSDDLTAQTKPMSEHSKDFEVNCVAPVKKQQESCVTASLFDSKRTMILFVTVSQGEEYKRRDLDA